MGAHWIRSNLWGCPTLLAGPAQQRDSRLAARRFAGWLFGSILCCTSHPPCCQPCPCCAMQANRTQRRSHARRVGTAPPAGTQLSNPGQSKALQKHWEGVQWCGCSMSGPRASLALGWPLTQPHNSHHCCLSLLSDGFAPQSRSCGSFSSKGTAVLQKHIHGA